MNFDYQFHKNLLVRAPHYSYLDYRSKTFEGFIADPDFRNALWLASPEFFGRLALKNFAPEKFSAAEVHTLRKYINRMCHRPTPFGAFASFTFAGWQENHQVMILGDRALQKLHLLPDIAYSKDRFQIAKLATDELPLRLNPCLYRVAGRYRYLYGLPGPKGRFQFSIDEVEAGRLNNAMIRLLRNDNLTVAELRVWVQQQTGCSTEDAKAYVEFLLEEQLLFTPLQGRVITSQADENMAAPQPIDLPRQLFSQSATAVGERKSDGALRSPYYAALQRPAVSGGASLAEQQELQAGLRLLERLAQPAMIDALEQFKKDFRQRFDLQQVPLLEALDPDIGISYDNRTLAANTPLLLQNLNFPGVSTTNRPWDSALRNWLLRHWLPPGNYKPGQTLEIREAMLSDLPPVSGQLPPSLALLYRKSAGYWLIDQVAGASAMPLLARFSVFDPAVAELGRSIATAEMQANPDVLFADIGQLSDSYVDNINRREPIYPYEIPVNTYSELPADHQLNPSDLLLSLRGDELILSSARWKKRVIPRLASAYNYRHNELPLFRLLCDLQFQGLKANLSLDLCKLFPGLSYYPRVSCGRLIISAAQWHLQAKDLPATQARINWWDRMQNWRQASGLPQFVALGETDQQLVINLHDEQDFNLLLQELSGKPNFVVREYLLSDDSVQVNGRPLTAQYVTLMTRQSTCYPALRLSNIPAKVSRTFLPGSDWLYLKWYCTGAAADRLLREVIAPVTQRKKHRLRQWFFIRYSDPGYHLRLRFRTLNGDTGPILTALHQQLERRRLQDLISDWQCATYHRELERYGARYIDEVEDVFRAGSELVCGFHRAYADDPEMLRGWGLLLIQRHLSVFLTTQQAHALVTRVLNNLLAAYNDDHNLRVQLDKNYRQDRPALQIWLNGHFPEQTPQPLQQHLGRLQGKLEILRRRSEISGREFQEHLLADLIHMQLNRLFSDSPRQQELAAYHMVLKFLEMQLARASRSTSG